MARDELASDGINRAGDTKEIGTDTHSQCNTNRFLYFSPDCGLSPVISSDFPSQALAYAKNVGKNILDLHNELNCMIAIHPYGSLSEVCMPCLIG
jgi:hypothetical protein